MVEKITRIIDIIGGSFIVLRSIQDALAFYFPSFYGKITKFGYTTLKGVSQWTQEQGWDGYTEETLLTLRPVPLSMTVQGMLIIMFKGSGLYFSLPLFIITVQWYGQLKNYYKKSKNKWQRSDMISFGIMSVFSAVMFVLNVIRI